MVPGPANYSFEQKEVLLNNTHPSIDAENLKHQNISEHATDVSNNSPT